MYNNEFYFSFINIHLEMASDFRIRVQKIKDLL